MICFEKKLQSNPVTSLSVGQAHFCWALRHTCGATNPLCLWVYVTAWAQVQLIGPHVGCGVVFASFLPWQVSWRGKEWQKNGTGENSRQFGDWKRSCKQPGFSVSVLPERWGWEGSVMRFYYSPGLFLFSSSLLILPCKSQIHTQIKTEI